MTASTSQEPLHCASCQERVDPLRAVGVRAQGEGFLYFCSAYCQKRFDSTAPPPQRQVPTSGFAKRRTDNSSPRTSMDSAQHALPSTLDPHSLSPSPVPVQVDGANNQPCAPATLTPAPSATRHESLREGLSTATKQSPAAIQSEIRALKAPTAARPAAPGVGFTRIETSLWAAAAGLGGLGLGLVRQEQGVAAISAGTSCLFMVASALTHHAQQPTLPSRLWNVLLSLGPLGAAALLSYECLRNGRHCAQFTVATAALGLSLATANWLMRRHGLAKTLKTPAFPPSSDASRGSDSPSPGDLIDVSAPCTLHEDCSIVSGSALATRWPGAVAEQCVVGQTLFSGATIEAGHVQARVHWTRQDRSQSRLVSSKTGYLLHRTAEIRKLNQLTSRGALAAGLAGGVAVAVNSHDALLGAMASCLVATLFACNPLTRLVIAMTTTRVHTLLERGVFFRDGVVFDLTSKAPSVVLSAASSLLHNAPQVDKVEPLFGAMEADDLLALAAGCFTTSESTMGTALRNAVLAARLKLPPVRSAHYLPGLGVVGVSAAGKEVVVGSRTLLLSQRISIARAESQMEGHEALGRSVILVAVGGHLAGLITLHDRRRPGAAQAVQSLHRANIEPILLSGDSRQTCDALALEMGITHIRPEVDPSSRDETLHALGASRVPLALIGRSSIDGNDLREIGVAINLDSRGAPLERWPVEVASGLIQDAAWAMVFCRRLRAQLHRVTRYYAVTAIVSGTLIAAGGPLWLAPLGLGLGAIVCAAYLELDSDRLRTNPKNTAQ